MTRQPRRRAAALGVLFLATRAWPCSIEIWSIEDLAVRASHIVIGRVVTVDDTLYVHPEDPDYALRVWRAATFRVEHVLKGAVEADIVRFRFRQEDPELLFATTCPTGYPYSAGDHKLVMLGESDDDGAYWPPRFPPSVISLPEQDAVGSALAEYVGYVGVHGRRPVELVFAGPTAVGRGQPIDLHVTVANRLSVPLTVVAMPGAYETPRDNGALVLLPLDRAGGGGVTPRAAHPDRAGFITVRGGGSGSFTVRISDYYDLRSGRYGLRGNIFLGMAAGARVGPGGAGGHVFRDRWYNFGPEFAFEVTDRPTAVESSSWGRVKARR